LGGPPSGDWQILDSDREFYSRHLHSFIPDRIFDAHCHLYDRSQFQAALPALIAGGPTRGDFETYRAQMDLIHPGRHCEGLFFGFPNSDIGIDAANRFVSQQVAPHPGSRSQMLIKPAMSAEFVHDSVKQNGFAGLKCYHLFATETPTFDASITSYLPEDLVRVAHELNLSVTLHMVRARALADANNQQVIRHYCERYPSVKLILAHAGRGFNPHHTIEGIGALQGLSNVWFDTSSIAEAGAFEAIVRAMGVSRLLYGSDFPVSHMRARCVAMGDSFLWLSRTNTQFQTPYGVAEPTLIALESLRALKLACWNLRLNDTVEAIFRTNAAQLFAL
jgi:glutamate-1-semialdehyde 2,1-aminomutase